MILTHLYLDQLSKFYTVAIGRKPGIFGHWDDADASATGYPGNKQKEFPKRRDALEFLVLHLTNASIKRKLNHDEAETLSSAKDLLESLPKEPVFSSLI